MNNETLVDDFSIIVIDAYKDYLRKINLSEIEIEEVVMFKKWKEVIRKENPTIPEQSVIPYAIRNISEQMAESICLAYDAFEIPIIIQSYLDRIKVWMKRLEEESERVETKVVTDIKLNEVSLLSDGSYEAGFTGLKFSK